MPTAINISGPSLYYLLDPEGVVYCSVNREWKGWEASLRTEKFEAAAAPIISIDLASGNDLKIPRDNTHSPSIQA